jgi:signal transduction histidine kinase
MQERIVTLLKGRTVLLGAVSHDIKTYITRLKLRTEMITDDDQRLLAERDLDDMTALIEDSLAAARGTSKRDRTALVDLADIFRTAVDGRRNVAVVVPARTLLVEGDPVALRRLFANLIDNALRYGAGACTIDVTEVGERARVTLDDNGPGIPAADRALVFEPFYRRETSRNRETGGSGLGLTIAKQIVVAHGGTIELAEAPARGLRVIVDLPIRDEDGEARPRHKAAGSA